MLQLCELILSLHHVHIAGAENAHESDDTPAGSAPPAAAPAVVPADHLAAIGSDVLALRQQVQGIREQNERILELLVGQQSQAAQPREDPHLFCLPITGEDGYFALLEKLQEHVNQDRMVCSSLSLNVRDTNEFGSTPIIKIIQLETLIFGQSVRIALMGTSLNTECVHPPNNFNTYIYFFNQ